MKYKNVKLIFIRKKTTYKNRLLWPLNRTLSNMIKPIWKDNKRIWIFKDPRQHRRDYFILSELFGIHTWKYKAHSIAQNRASSAKRQKESYDPRVKIISLKAGNIIWYHHETTREEIHTGDVVLLWKNKTLSISEINAKKFMHHNKIEKYNSTDVPIWCKR